MDKAAVLNIVADFKSSIEKRGIHIDKLLLFGSFANDNFNALSDIDIAVISDDFKNMDYWERINILSESIYDVFAPIEAVAFTPEEWENKTSMIIEYAERGEVLYC